MSTGHRCSAWKWLLLAIFVSKELVLPGSAWAADDHKEVLVLHSTRRDSQLSTIGEEELPRILDAGLGRDLDYYSEFIDTARFPDSSYQEAFSDYVRKKYQGTRFDIVIAMGDVAVRFVGRNRDGLFLDVPVVFLKNTPATPDVATSTGLILERNFSPTLSVIRALQPDVNHVFVVTGAAPVDKAFETQMRAQFKPFEPRLAFTYLAGLTSEELERRLAALPKRSAVYYGLVTEDGAGHKFHPLEYIDRVAAVASAPVYCWVDSAMGHGIVGGGLYSQRAATDQVAQLALRVLHGERPDDIPTSALRLTATQIDWRQLRRWGLSEARLPAGALVLFREPSIWDRYAIYIVGAGVILLAQSALIAGLLVQRGRRRQAEAQVRRSQEELRTSYDKIHDLGRRLLTAQDTERARIARELHDDISQQLAALAIQLTRLSADVRGQTRNLAGDLMSRAQGVAKSVHDLSHRLHPAKLRLVGLVGAIEGLQSELKQSGVSIAFTHDKVPAALSPELTVCLFRTVQEALHNALKHSGAQHVSVDLRGGSDGLTLSIVDDGVGFDVESAWGRGLGLISMAERLEAVDSSLQIRSTSGAGTRLDVRVPLRVIAGTASVAV